MALTLLPPAVLVWLLNTLDIRTGRRRGVVRPFLSPVGHAHPAGRRRLVRTAHLPPLPRVRRGGVVRPLLPIGHGWA